MTDETFLLKTAPQFDVHKWSDYPEVTRVMDAIFEEIKTLRTSRNKKIRGADKVKKHLRVVLIELWAASYLSSNPYRSISKNKTDFQRETRYRRIYLKYDYFVGVVNDLKKLEYLNETRGFLDRRTGVGYRTRIKATDKLLTKIQAPEYGVDSLISAHGMISIVQDDARDRETIILKDADDNLTDYADDENTNLMRSNLSLINSKLALARITLDITDEQANELYQRLNDNRDKDRIPVNFTHVKLHRVFNNSSWQQGGRFYGGWWINLPKEYRKYITINHGMTHEIDYSGHHYRILYAEAGLEPPDDPYELEGFDREEMKLVGMIMLNSLELDKALSAMLHKGILNSKTKAKAFAKKHAAIKQHFFSGVGLKLQYKDSLIAEQVILRMMELGAVVLPVHDSFIVRRGYQDELKKIMENEFELMFGIAKVEPKETFLEESSRIRNERGEDLIANLSLEEYFRNRNWVNALFGM